MLVISGTIGTLMFVLVISGTIGTLMFVLVISRTIGTLKFVSYKWEYWNSYVC